MKLVDILARELKVWPNFLGDTIGQAQDGTLHNAYGPPKWTIATYTLCDYLADQVTRAQWQAAVDALKAEKIVEWNGEGLPPVGTVCEVCFGSEVVWRECRVVGIDGKEAVLNYKGLYYAQAGGFRPIRTPEQIAEEEREKAIDEMRNIFMRGQNSVIRVADCCKRLYDAGYRKQKDA